MMVFQAIRKQTLLMLEDRGFGRDHEMFKDIFGMATKGTYFAFVSVHRRRRHETWLSVVVVMTDVE